MAISRTFARLSILGLLTSLFVSPPIMASASGTCVVNDYGDTAGTSSNRTLRYCIANVGDDGTITFDNTTAETITVSTQALLVQNGGITIDGAGLITLTTTAPSTSTTYEASPSSYPLVTVDLTSNTSATTTFKGLTFNGATNGSSVTNGSAVTGSAEGGAINAAWANLGRLYGFDVSIEDSSFNFNRASNGGAIAADILTVTNSSFEGNRATTTTTGKYGGGALLANEATIDSSYFDTNTAPNAGITKGGGAVYVFKFTDIDSSSFTNNSASKRGGAIFDGQSMNSQRQPSQVSNSFFESNTAGTAGDTYGTGGAIYFESLINGLQPIVENSTFLSNEAGQRGGAISTANGAIVTLSTFYENSTDDDFNGQSLQANFGTIYILGNLFLDATSGSRQVWPRENQAVIDDGGANLSTGSDVNYPEPFGSESRDGFDIATLGIDVSTMATPSKTVQPFLPVSDLSATGLEITEAMATALVGRYVTAMNNSVQADSNNPVTYSLPSSDQQGNARSLPMFPGAEYGTSAAPESPSAAAPAPYTGPLITSIGQEQTAGAFQTTSSATVGVFGERLSGVSKAFIEGKEASILSTSNESFVMTLPAGLSPGIHDLVIHSPIGNLTYLDGLFISDQRVQKTAYGEMSAWTVRISDTQAKVYVKYPTVGEKLRISHQSGDSGAYETVYVKTTVSESDPAMIVNEHGSYIVRTIDLVDINRIRVTVGDQRLVQVRYNR